MIEAKVEAATGGARHPYVGKKVFDIQPPQPKCMSSDLRRPLVRMGLLSKA
jgi:hypothetical protein